MIKIKASASQIIKWLKCPRAWALRYIEKIYEPKSIHLYRGTFIHSYIESLHNISLKENGINKNNYSDKLPECAWALFERMIDEPTNNFGKEGPTYREQLKELFPDDNVAIEEAIEDTRAMLRVYLQRKMMEVEVWTVKYNSFSKAWNAIKPRFKEFPIQLEEFQGSLDEVYDIDGEIIISDLKSSTLAVGKDPMSDRYKQMGITGLNKEYVLQLFLYAWAYYKQTGIMADWLSLNYIKHGHEVLIPFKFMDRHQIVDQMDKLVNEFLEATKSKDIADYPCNPDSNASVSEHFCLDNTFCSAAGTKFEARHFCHYDSMCGAIGTHKSNIVKDAAGAEHLGIYIDDVLHMLPCWIFEKKNLTPSGSFKCSRETEKAMLIESSEGSTTWIPKSQLGTSAQ